MPPPSGRANPRLLIGCYFPRSISLEGIGTFIRGVADEMRRCGWDVSLLCPADQAQSSDDVQLVPYRPGPFGLYRYLSALRRASSRADAVLLVESNPNMGFTASFSAARGKTFSYFCTPLQRPSDLRRTGWSRQTFVHGVGKSPFWSRLQRWSARSCIVASEYQAQQLRRLGASQIHVIPASGVAIARSVPDRAAARRTLGWNCRPVVGYLGHFSPAKGVHTLIDAFYERDDTPATLALAYSGKGKLPAKQDRRLAELCATGRATLMGVVDPLVFLAACDVTVLPYLTSSIYHLPQVLLESFAAGTVVISTSVGGIGELVVPAQTGQLVPPGDHHALGTAMVESLTNLDAAHRMGRHARAVFERQLSTEVFCNRFERLLNHELN